MLSLPPEKRVRRRRGGWLGRQKLTCAVDVAQHGGGDVDGEDVVAVGQVRERAGSMASRDHIRIGEETDAGNQTDLDVEPTVK